MCGGWGLNNSKMIFLRGREMSMECWWFTPVPVPRWDPFIESMPEGSTESPIPRARHVISFDVISTRVLLFGGVDKDMNKLNDCWYLDLSHSLGSDIYAYSFEWMRCDSTGKVLPPPRYGHNGVVFDKAFYIFGGFTENGPQNDMWRLESYTANGSWYEVMPASGSPSPRAQFACWLSGFQLYIHGGEGAAHTLQDTWAFNFFTRVWTVAASVSPLAASRLAIASPFGGDSAVSFGGRSAAGIAVGQTFAFSAVDGWAPLLPAGVRPSRRSGHVAGYDARSRSMVVALGMSSGAEFEADLWVLDTAASTWTCLAGAASACLSPPILPPTGPGARAFAASVQAGLRLFVFGGLTYTCLPGGVRLPVANSDLWLLDLATLRWSAVVTGGGGGPGPRTMATLVHGEAQNGLKDPLMLFGGADVACVLRGCDYPAPLSDVWAIDAALAREPGRPATDRVAELDGNDIVEVPLPASPRVRMINDAAKISSAARNQWCRAYSTVQRVSAAPKSRVPRVIHGRKYQRCHA
jgi:hypothetical protein